MSNTATIIVIAVVVVVLGLVAFMIIRRQRYVRALRGRGWSFESNPQLESVLEHRAPPFGLGFVRKVDEGIAGTTQAGVPFRVFEYACSGGGPKYDERLASLTLPLALPELFVTGGQPRPASGSAPSRSTRGCRSGPPTSSMREPPCPARC